MSSSPRKRTGKRAKRLTIPTTWDGNLNRARGCGIPATANVMLSPANALGSLFWNNSPYRASGPLSASLGRRACRPASVVVTGFTAPNSKRRLLIATLGLLAGCSSRLPTINESLLRACDADAGGSFVEEVATPMSVIHTDEPQDYGDKPPVGGDHNRCWGSWGVHSSPLPLEWLVHNLEHGGIGLQYNCPDGCNYELRWLTEFTLTHELVVLTENPQLGTRFGLSAWNARAYSDCLSPDFVRDFYQRRVDRAPEQFGRPAPEPPSSCE